MPGGNEILPIEMVDREGGAGIPCGVYLKSSLDGVSGNEVHQGHPLGLVQIVNHVSWHIAYADSPTASRASLAS
jgi:hypothetical protein